MDKNSTPEPKHGKWTDREDAALRSAMEEYGEHKWKQISKKVKGRSPIQCLHRWTKILKPGLVKGPWTGAEDEVLVNWVQKEGPKKWSKCSKAILGRSGKQCRERWFNNLDPSIKKGEWTHEEDVMIFNVFQTIGPKWAFIAKFLVGRTENSIKNRFYSTIRKIDSKNRAAEEIQEKCPQGLFDFCEAFKMFDVKSEAFFGQEGGLANPGMMGFFMNS